MAFIGNIFGAYAAKQLGKYNQDLFNLQARIDKRNAEIKKKTFDQVDLPRLLKHQERTKSNLLVSLLKSGVDIDRVGETPYLVMLEQGVEHAFDVSLAKYNSRVAYQNEINRSLLTEARGRAEKYKGDLMFRSQLAQAAGDIYTNRAEYRTLLQ
jgi:hypothetical protein